jgi:hypothetical protein
MKSQSKFINILALLVSLSLSAVAAYYSIIGLTAIFAASFWPIVVMGSTLELAKVVTTSWLYQNWTVAPRFVRYYLMLAITVLMFITSIGIFGYLSKAHIDQSSKTSISVVDQSAIQTKIDIANQDIAIARSTLASLDDVVKALTDAQRIRGAEGAVAVRNNQQAERDALNVLIAESSKTISALLEEKQKVDTETSALESEVGPLKYVAEIVYGKSDVTTVEHAVRLVILTIIFVFDPLAVLLLIGANAGLNHANTTVKAKRKKYKPRVKKDIPVWNTVQDLSK